jgi:hypothetical protein
MSDTPAIADTIFRQRFIRAARVALVSSIILLAVATPRLAVALQVVGSSGGADELAPELIVERALARAEAQVETGIDGQFEATVLAIVRSIDGEGEVADIESTLYQVYPLNGAVYEEIVEKDGRPLTDREARKERKEKDGFIREVEKRKERGLPPQPDDERRVRFDRELMSRYRFEIIGEEEVRGDPCWVVYFEPRDGELPEKTRMDTALNRSTGRLWIAKADYGVPRVEFDLDEPIRYLGGFLATVRETAGRVEYQRIEPDVWLPTEFELELDLRILVKNIRRVISRRWSDYRRVDSDAGS